MRAVKIGPPPGVAAIEIGGGMVELRGIEPLTS